MAFPQDSEYFMVSLFEQKNKVCHSFFKAITLCNCQSLGKSLEGFYCKESFCFLFWNFVNFSHQRAAVHYYIFVIRKKLAALVLIWLLFKASWSHLCGNTLVKSCSSVRSPSKGLFTGEECEGFGGRVSAIFSLLACREGVEHCVGRLQPLLRNVLSWQLCSADPLLPGTHKVMLQWTFYGQTQATPLVHAQPLLLSWRAILELGST